MAQAITNYFRSLMLTELVKGMRLTGRHLFSRKITVQYPEEKTTVFMGGKGTTAKIMDGCWHTFILHLKDYDELKGVTYG